MLRGMQIGSLEALTRVLQASISPVALLSGVGLLILSQTNRFSRVTERLRELARQCRAGPTPEARLENQLRIFHQRAEILRQAIGSAVVAALLASVVVVLVFAIAVLELPLHWLALVLFAVCLAALVLSLTLFLIDMRLSLKAVQEEIRDVFHPAGNR